LEPYSTPDLRRRVGIVAATACIFSVVGFVRGLLMLAAGTLSGALLLGLAVLIALLVLVFTRQGRSIQLTGNLVVGALVVTCVGISVARGGVGSPVTAGAGIAILLAVLTCGVRVGLAWLILVIVLAGVDAGLQLQGMGFPDRVAPEWRFTVDLSATIVIPSVVFFVGMAFEWTKSEALREQVELEAERQRAEHLAVLTESERLAALGTLTAGIGHEINNPLTYILGNLQLLQMECSSSPDQRAMVDETLAGVEQIRDVVKEMMTYVRSDADEQLERVDVAQTLQTAVTLSQSQLKRVGDFELDLQSVPRVVGIPHRLSQVWINLLVNACQATAENQGRARRVHARLFADGSKVHVEVEDNGKGIPNDLVSRIFDPFFSTKSPGQGTGLGLSVSARIVQDMDGDIEVESGEGRTVFRVTLPVNTAMIDESTPELRSLARPVRVLIVDDDLRIGRVLATMLEAPHELVAVGGAAAALERLREDQAWDVVVTDVMMPGLSGVDLFDALQAAPAPLGDLPVVFMTGGITDPDLQRRVMASACPVLAKPLSPGVLVDAIAGALEG